MSLIFTMLELKIIFFTMFFTLIGLLAFLIIRYIKLIENEVKEDVDNEITYNLK